MTCYQQANLARPKEGYENEEYLILQRVKKYQLEQKDYLGEEKEYEG